MMLCCVFQQRWLVHFDPCYSLSGLLPRRSAVALLSCYCVSWWWASMLLEFLSTIPVDVVKVKSYMKCMLFTRRCHVVERSLMWQNGIWLVEYNSSTWKKLPYLHVVQWLGIFKLDFGRCFHSTWWNVSCLACVLWEKEREKHILN